MLMYNRPGSVILQPALLTFIFKIMTIRNVLKFSYCNKNNKIKQQKQYCALRRWCTLLGNSLPDYRLLSRNTVLFSPLVIVVVVGVVHRSLQTWLRSSSAVLGRPPQSHSEGLSQSGNEVGFLSKITITRAAASSQIWLIWFVLNESENVITN